LDEATEYLLLYGELTSSGQGNIVPTLLASEGKIINCKKCKTLMNAGVKYKVGGNLYEF